MAAVLLQALERAELNKLPKGVQNKLERFVTELQNANEALQTERERLRADCEQQYFDIEKKLAETKEQFLSSTKDLQTVKEENRKLNDELSTLKGIEGESADEKTSQPQQQTKTKYEIEAEKRELARLLEKRTQEVENLNEDLTRLNEKLVETNKVKMDLQLKLDEIQSSEASGQHRQKRMEQEKELLQQKIDWLTSELKAKTDELLETNRDKGKQIVELQSSVKTSKEEVTRLESQLTSLKETSENQTKRAEDLNNKLKKAKDEQCSMEEKYRNELNAHIKLSSLYKSSASDMETKNSELSRAVEGLSKMIKEAGDANKVLEKKVSETEEQKTRLEAELREKIKKMEKELENASVKAAGKHCCAQSLTEEQLDAMCPSAAAIAAIVKPGMKFFHLYNAFAECQTQLQLEQQETKRVNRVLDEIVQEVETKAPVLKRQREEYESMQRSMASLCNKLEQARSEIYSLQKEKDETKQKCDVLDREKKSTEQQLEDTSTQVCTLLMELEEARGNQGMKNEGSSTTMTFRSIQELQQQNQTMLKRLKELEDDKNKRQTLVTSERVTELEASVNKLQKEIEQLKEQRNQQKQLADSNARQRDMYKALLTQSTGYTLPPQGSESLSQSAQVRPSVPATRSMPQRAAAAESAQTAQAKAALKQLSDSFMLYKKEKAENDRMLNETNERLQKQLSELSSRNAKLTSQLDFNNKRYDLLQENMAAYPREIAALQDRHKKMTATAQSQEHIILTMTNDLRQANEKLALEEVRVQNLTKEKEMLRQAESRLQKEKEAILTEQRNQNLLLTNLKTIQLTMERTETDSRQRLNNKIEQLESELAAMKTKLNQEVEQRHALGRSMDAQLLEAKKQLETQNTLQQKTRELLRSSEQQVAALKAQLASASASGPDLPSSSSAPVTAAGRAAMLRTQMRVRSPGPPVSQQPTVSEQELNEVKGQLRTVEEQKSELQEQLKNANSRVEQYRAVVLALEDSLKKEKESRTPLEARLKEAQEVQEQLEQRIVEVEKMKVQEEEKRRKAVDAVEKQVMELQRSLKSSQTEQREALERRTLAVTQEEKAIQESRQQTKFAEEAQAKYEKELMLHAADVEALQDLKKRFQEITTSKQEVEEKLNKISALLQEKTATWSTVEKQLKDNLSNESRRCEELTKQNSLLHKQMDELASKSRAPHVLQPQNLDLSFSEEGKTTEQILEILRFVRREKEIAVARFEASEGEALRHKQRVEYQDQELKELQEALNGERQRMQLTTKTLAQQEQQLKRMESIGALHETNRLLKLDKDKLEHEVRIFKSKVSKLQSDIAPLHQSLSALSEKNGSLQADKRILDEDLKRWKAKAQQLANQQKDGDTDEKQKLITERDAHLKRITQLTEEGARLKTELAKANVSNNSAQSQLQSLKDAVTRATTERDNAKKEVETKNHDILEKNKTITQVKKIGRRYKTQYEELKAQHDKLVQETTAKQGSEANSEAQQTQLLTQAQEDLKKTREELDKHKEDMQKKVEEIQKSKQELEEAQKENQQTKEKLQELQNLQNQLNQKQTQLSQVQSQLSQTQTQLQQNQNQHSQAQKELQQAKTQNQQLQNQLKTAQTVAQTRQNQNQQIQKELQQAKENLQQKEKEIQQAQQSTQQSLNQEINNLKTAQMALSQADVKVTELQGQLDKLQKTLGERDAEVKRLEEQLTEAKRSSEATAASHSVQPSQSTQSQSSEGDTGGDPGREDELNKLRQELSESRNREEQLRQQMSEKEEKTKKVVLGAKTKISQLNSLKDQLSKELEEVKQDKEEQEVRMNAIKSQYEMRLSRLDRELRELKETQTEARDETQDQGGAKGGDQARPSEPRQISLKSPAQDRGSSSLSEPPTANIRPTPSTPSPSSKPSPTPGSKSTPRASIRPMVTPPSLATPTPTATVMPTTQADSQEASLGAGAAVHSTSSSLTTIAQPTSSQATAFVQPTQQQSANQEPGSSMEAERPSTSSASLPPGSKRVRDEEEEEEDSRPQSSHTSPTTKKLRLKPSMGLQVEEEEEDIDEELGDTERPDSADSEMAFPVMAAEDEEVDDEGVSQSVPSDQEQTLVRDVIVIDTDSESRESKETEKQQEEDDGEEDDEEDEEEEEQEDEYKDDEEDDEEDDGSGDGGTRPAEGSNEESRDADEEDEEEPSESVRSEDQAGATASERASEPSHSGEGRSGGPSSEADPPRDLLHLPPLSSAPTPSPSSLAPRLPQPRRPPHSVPPRLYIQPPAPELGPPHAQRQSSQLRRQSVGRGLQLTPGIGSTQQHFFDDDDRMVPSTPTLVVPHRSDGFAEAIHSPQVAGLSTRFRFGPPEDLLPQASASHSDLGQLASQGGLGMYESPLFLAAHDEDGGGRSVPTTPLQVAAPVTVFTESLPSDGADNMASQSVPMVTASTAMSSAADDGDEVFMEHEAESAGLEPSLDSQADMDSAAQQSEDAALPSTSQDPDTSSATQRRTLPSQPMFSSLLGRGGRGRGEGRTLISRRGPYSRGGRGSMGRGGFL